MTIRVGINGFGRIGRSVFRVCLDRPNIEIVAINDLFRPEMLAYLLRYDSVMGVLPKPVGFGKDHIDVDGKSIHITAERNPNEIPWKQWGVDIVVESTGVFGRKTDLEKHLQAGAKRVVLTVPPKDAIDHMVVMGVNDHTLTPDHYLVSNASCTTNCLAPVAKVLHQNFGIEYGLMTTVHAFTNDQRLLDSAHSDLRRSRAATHNLIPTSTGAARAVGKILPELNGKLDGMALRVNVVDGSMIDLTVKLEKKVSVEAINTAMRKAAESGPLLNILAYNQDALVSRDIIGNSHSSIFDAALTQVDASQNNLARVVSWYDNEWGYSQRCADLIQRLSAL